MRFNKDKPNRILWRTDQIYDFLAISAPTFRRYRNLLGIRGRKITGHRGRFYTWEEIMQIMELHAPPAEFWVLGLEERFELLKRVGRL